MKLFKGLSGIVVLVCLLSCSAMAHAVEGRWRGELKIGNASLPIVFDFKKTGDGLGCTLDSPAQNAYGLPANVEYESHDSIAVALPVIRATFHGSLAGSAIRGIFEQGGMKLPLTLESESPLSQRRPQTPVSPFPYHTVDTVFSSSDGTKLAGTLVLPDQSVGYAVVMVTGSGPQNRDEEIFEHKPFAVIADYLARNGIASFRYDDRGTAESNGDFTTATVDTFRDDAASALAFVRDMNRFRKVGIIGHSEGGTIALMLAADGKTDFAVSLAGMVISGKETILSQNRHAMEKGGMSHEEIENSLIAIGAVFDAMTDSQDRGSDAPINVDSIVAATGVEIPSAIMQSIKKSVIARTPYFDHLLSLDVSHDLGRIECPVLALNGLLDTQVDPVKNLATLQNGVRKAEIHKLPGLNHLFQHAMTGEIDEYSTISETISPEVLQLIVDFILRR